MNAIRAVIVLILAASIAACAPSDLVPQQVVAEITPEILNCSVERSTLGNETTIGIQRTRNVFVALRNERGRAVPPTAKEEATTRVAVYERLFYDSTVVQPGEYTVEVRSAETLNVVANYVVQLVRNGGPLLIITCD